MPTFRISIVIALTACCLTGVEPHLVVVGAAEEPDRVDFNRDVRPILSENCFACHGFDEKSRQADLRLDLAESARAPRKAGAAFSPGKPAASLAWQRIISTDADERMPPPTSNLALTPTQKQTLRKWIEQGAEYAGHWSFIPPVRGRPPVADARPIDAFVQARLRAEGLRSAPRADRAALIRRLSLDLLGLPPTPEETVAFERDTDPRAYENLVDRLLQSPHVGERLALDWLDAARYADTNGFSIDGGRHLWLWRDWVIQAFNDNLPYDRFLIEQIAGDLLPNRTEAQLIATGFQRNNMVTHEGGTIPAENLANYNADRVKTLGEAVLGLTLGCAQCHNHKFDPVTQRDYYRMFAFFNTLSDKGLDGNSGVNPGPTVQARTVLRTNEEPTLRAEIAFIEAKLARYDEGIFRSWQERERAQLERRGERFALHPIAHKKVSTPNRGAGFDIETVAAPATPNGSPAAPRTRVRLKQPGDLAAFDVSCELPRLDTPITAVRLVVHPLTEFPGGGWGPGPVSRGAGKPPAGAAPAKGTFMLTAITATVDTVPSDQVNQHKLLPIARVTASSWDADHPPRDCLDPRNETGWSPDLEATGPVHLTATFAEPIDARVTPFLTMQVNFGHGRGLVPGLFELQAVTGIDDGSDLPVEIIVALERTSAERTADEQSRLWSYCARHAAELTRERVTLANLRERLAVLTERFPTMVMDTAPQPRDTFILARGDYSKPTEKVTAGTIAALPPMAGDLPLNRLGLAKWLTGKEHPLTARVAVNRFWKLFFGTGLVATPADFGAQGEWPSHPELLDWLAVDFVESGWDVKRLLKQIAMSETYQQSSAATPEALARDPQNRWLSRGARFRLPAELIRDSALSVSGLLVKRLGGPSVNPYTPGDPWREVSHYGSTPATAQTFVQDHGEKLYRRSLYTYWKRTVPPPNMTVFDAPNREVCTVSRANTTTPLQALVLLNDVQFVEAARAFAERMLSQPGDDTSRLAWGWRAVTARAPQPSELRILTAALARERRRYTEDEPGARKLLAVGESPRVESLPVTEHAAWGQIGALLLNLSETIMRQ